MIQKLKDASNIILVLTVVLYFFGFICLNAYYARFGIVSFDIVNSRFIIAGIYPLISLVVVLMLAWRLYKKLPHTQPPLMIFFETKNWKKRYGAFLDFIIWIVSAAFVLSVIINLGSYRSALGQESLVFSPVLGRYDYIGEYINRLPIDNSSGMNVIVKMGLNIFPYLFLLALILFLMKHFIWRFVSQDKNIGSESSQKQNADQNLIYPKYFSVFVFGLDILFISLFISAAIYAYCIVYVGIIDFGSFNQYQSVTTGLLLAWLFSSIVPVFLFLFNMEIPPEQFKFNLLGFVSDYGVLQYITLLFVIPLLLWIFMFGITIFPKIPFAMGGAEPRLIKLTMIDSNHEFKDDKMYLIGESSQFFFIIATSNNGEKGRALQINKSTVAYIGTKSISDKSK